MASINKVNTQPSRITHAGKRVFYPKSSDLYAVNPSPQYSFFRKQTYDYLDENMNVYYDVMKVGSENLLAWLKTTILPDLISQDSEILSGELEGEKLFLVRPNDSVKENCQVFIPAEKSERLTLTSIGGEDNLECVVVNVGQQKCNKYAARSVVWMLVKIT